MDHYGLRGVLVDEDESAASAKLAEGVNFEGLRAHELRRPRASPGIHKTRESPVDLQNCRTPCCKTFLQSFTFHLEKDKLSCSAELFAASAEGLLMSPHEICVHMLYVLIFFVFI